MQFLFNVLKSGIISIKHPSGRGRLACACLLGLGLVGSLPAQADYKDDVGHTALAAELGAALPDGAGVRVDQVEAPVSVGGQQAWMPNPGANEYSGKTITDVSGNGTEVYSGHAAGVANNFYGNTISTSPGITLIDSYSASHWIFAGFLRVDTGPGLNPQPLSTASRISNHSWTGNTGSSANDVNALSRVDWIIQRDEMTQVAGAPSGKLLSGAFNVIAVDPTFLTSTGGSANVGGIYTGGRTKPDLVAPATSTSNATPRVASAAALLINAAHDNPSWSTDPAVTSTTNRNGDSIYNAERAEVVKAALMAGADRSTSNTSPASNPGDITDYRVNAADQTNNGLDRRYGAGQLNIDNSYHVIAAGEQNSNEDQPGGAGVIGPTGFDYDPAFGGAGSSNATATYYFAQTAGPAQLAASLVCNLAIDGGSANNFDETATLYDLDLQLFDVTDSQNWVLVADSASTNQNTENLWLTLDSGKNYALRVIPGPSQTAFNWDFALAWNVTPIAEPLAITTTYAPEVGVKNQFYWWGGLSASGGKPPYTYSLVAGWITWPLTLEPDTGVIKGVPASAETSYFKVQVMDANSDTATINLQITVKKAAYVCGSCHSAPDF